MITITDTKGSCQNCMKTPSHDIEMSYRQGYSNSIRLCPECLKELSSIIEAQKCKIKVDPGFKSNINLAIHRVVRALNDIRVVAGDVNGTILEDKISELEGHLSNADQVLSDISGMISE